MEQMMHILSAADSQDVGLPPRGIGVDREKSVKIAGDVKK